MIFITLGSQKFQFNRLLKEVDRLIGEKKILEDVFAQTGHSDYNPVNYAYEKFVDKYKFEEMINFADIIITHGGTGAIINAIKRDKKVIAVPRLSQHGEHVDEHQIQIIEQLSSLNLICGCSDCTELEDKLKDVRNKEFNKFISNTNVIIESLDSYIRLI